MLDSGPAIADLKARLDTVSNQLAWVSEALIPADPDLGMPSAWDAGLKDVLLPRALKARDDFQVPFFATLERLPGSPPDDPMAVLLALDPGEFALLSRIVAGAYFLDEGVNTRLGYPGQEAKVYNPDYDEIMEVVGRVIERGPKYIDPDA